MKFSINRLSFQPETDCYPAAENDTCPPRPVNLNQHAFNVYNRVQSLDLIPGKCCNLPRHATLLELSKLSCTTGNQSRSSDLVCIAPRVVCKRRAIKYLDVAYKCTFGKWSGLRIKIRNTGIPCSNSFVQGRRSWRALKESYQRSISDISKNVILRFCDSDGSSPNLIRGSIQCVIRVSNKGICDYVIGSLYFCTLSWYYCARCRAARRYFYFYRLKCERRAAIDYLLIPWVRITRRDIGHIYDVMCNCVAYSPRCRENIKLLGAFSGNNRRKIFVTSLQFG